MFLVVVLFGGKVGKVILSILFVVISILYINDIMGPFNRIIDLVTTTSLYDLEGSAIQRLGRLIISINIWLDNFWIGVGLHNIGQYTTNYYLDDWFIYDSYFVFSNSYLTQLLAESGALGFIFISIFFMYIFKRLYDMKFHHPQFDFFRSISLALLLVFFVGQDLPLFSPFRLIFLILVFITINIFKNIQKTSETQYYH